MKGGGGLPDWVRDQAREMSERDYEDGRGDARDGRPPSPYRRIADGSYERGYESVPTPPRKERDMKDINVAELARLGGGLRAAVAALRQAEKTAAAAGWLEGTALIGLHKGLRAARRLLREMERGLVSLEEGRPDEVVAGDMRSAYDLAASHIRDRGEDAAWAVSRAEGGTSPQSQEMHRQMEEAVRDKERG